MSTARQRSKAYPVIDLETAEKVLLQVKKSLGDGPYDRDTIASAMGSKSGGGSAARKIAALVHYGLMQRKGSEYRISAIGKRLASPISVKEAQEARIEAFHQPTLFQEVLQRFSGEGHLPKMLSNVLSRDHGISDAAKDDAAESFVSSAKYVGVVNGDLAFTDGDVEVSPKQSGSEAADSDARVDDRADIREVAKSGKQLFRMSLTGGKQMYWELPDQLNSKDIAIIEKHIELLRLQIED